MAKMTKKAKKKQGLSAEELLEQALVPESEWPYEVPGNWVWVVLGHSVIIKRGASPRPIKAFTTEDEGGVNWIKIGDTGEGKYVHSVKEKITSDGASKSVFVDEGTLLLSNSMSFGRPYILCINGCIHDGWLAISVSSCFTKDYMYYALLASKWYFEQVAVGTAVRNLNSERVACLPVSLPPIGEQHRIVNRIENLFNKLDQAKGLIQDALDSIELRKAAILHKAFTGKLTKKWREENGVEMDSWEDTTFGECSTLMQNGLSKRKGTIGDETVVLRLANIQNDEILEENFRTIVLDQDEIDKYSLDIDDTLLVRVNGSIDRVGQLIRIKNNNKWSFCDHLIRIKFDQNIVITQYMVYFTMTDQYKGFIQKNIVSSAGQNTISQKSINPLIICIPTRNEQEEIVKEIDSIFDKEQSAKELCDIIDNIDQMKKSILARAFRGLLGTNDPSEESALELLKDVLMSR